MIESRSAATGSPEEGTRRTRVLLVFISTAALIVIADQLTKTLVASTIPLNRGIELVPGVLDIVHARNPGAAFGILSNLVSHWSRIFFIGVSIAALAVILWLVLISKGIEWSLLGGYSLFFGGTVGNLVDRMRFGEVVDFIHVHWENLYWPAFNVADSALCVGTALFVLHFLRQRRDERDTTLRSRGDAGGH